LIDDHLSRARTRRKVVGASLVVALAMIACGGDSRPSHRQWADGAQPTLTEILGHVTDLARIDNRLPGDYVPAATLQACDAIESGIGEWTAVLSPSHSEAVDLRVASLIEGLEETCAALRLGDIGLAQHHLGPTRLVLRDLFFAA
jgi:hypothetical protein